MQSDGCIVLVFGEKKCYGLANFLSPAERWVLLASLQVSELNVITWPSSPHSRPFCDSVVPCWPSSSCPFKRYSQALGGGFSHSLPYISAVPNLRQRAFLVSILS